MLSVWRCSRFSGIRVMMEKATQMQKKGEDVIHMEIGRPDFDTPQVIKDAAYDSIRRGQRVLHL